MGHLATTADGARTIWETRGSLTADDTDSLLDVYQRAGGATTLRTGPSTPGATPRSAFAAGYSSDLSHLFFGTYESFAPEDTDGHFDVYDASGGRFTLVSTGPSDDGSDDVDYGRNPASADGTHFVWESPQRFTADDTDDPAAPFPVRDDLYVRANGQTMLVSGPAEKKPKA
jgi:hypothetical protein